jgi:hypothetical protein
MLNVAKYDKSRTEILGSVVFYLPRDIPVEDFYRPGTQEKKLSHQKLEITKDTRVSEILEAYGDIADVMEVFGVKRVARYSLRALAAKALTVEWAARIHRVPLDEFLGILQKATQPTK